MGFCLLIEPGQWNAEDVWIGGIETKRESLANANGKLVVEAEIITGAEPRQVESERRSRSNGREQGEKRKMNSSRVERLGGGMGAVLRHNAYHQLAPDEADGGGKPPPPAEP